MNTQLGKYFEGKLSTTEEVDLLHAIENDTNSYQQFIETKTRYSVKAEYAGSSETLRAWKKVQSKTIAQTKDSKKHFMFRFYQVAAVILILLSTGLLVAKQNQSFQYQSMGGQPSKITLPDRTELTLNAFTSISYSSRWFGLRRIVTIQGEGFFSVSKIPFGKFTVIADDLNIEVVGTEFNVSNYRNDSNISVVLEEGEVRLFTENTFRSKMKVGEQVLYNKKENSIAKSEFDLSTIRSWRKGVLHFARNPLPDFIDAMEKRYGVTIRLKNREQLQDLTLTCTIRDEGWANVVDFIVLALPVKIYSEEQVFYIALDQERISKLKHL